MFDLVLYRPEIPGNCGNIIRLCVNTGVALHLIQPLGFTLDDARLRRAGLDYHEWARVRQHASLDACLAALSGPRLMAVETGGATRLDGAGFRSGDALLLGPESGSLPDELLAALPPAQRIAIPMQPGSRSLNLANAAAVVVYEAWRQLGFAGAVSPLPAVTPGP